MNDQALASSARSTASGVPEAVERIYWLEDRGFYAFATKDRGRAAATQNPDHIVRRARSGWTRWRRRAWSTRTPFCRPCRLVAHARRAPGAARDRSAWQRRARDRLGHAAAVEPERAVRPALVSLRVGVAALHRLGLDGRLSARTSARRLSGADGERAAHLRGALGYVTELLSGDFNARVRTIVASSDLVRGDGGDAAHSRAVRREVAKAGTSLEFAPQLPADWDRASLANVPAGGGRYDLSLERSRGRMTITVQRQTGSSGAALRELVIAPAFPLDATVQAVTVDGRAARFEMIRRGDVQHARVVVATPAAVVKMAVQYLEGSDVFAAPVDAGARRREQRPQGSQVDCRSRRAAAAARRARRSALHAVRAHTTSSWVGGWRRRSSEPRGSDAWKSKSPSRERRRTTCVGRWCCR